MADSRRVTPPDRTAVGESIVAPAVAMRKGGSDGPAVAVVGCGAWGINHVRVWRDLGVLRVACDLDPARRETVRTRYPGVETSDDVDSVLDRPDIAAVVVATPASTHAALASKALDAGKDVLVEKPMALQAAEGERLVEHARRRERVLMVGHVLEYHPAVRKLWDLVRGGALGRVRYIYSHRLNLGHFRAEESALWNFAPHDIAIMLRILDAMPEELACYGGAYLNHDVADVTLTSLRFPGGVHAHIFVSWLHPFKEQRFVVVGDHQMAVFEDTRPWPEKLLLYPHRVDWPGGRLPVARRAESVPVELAPVEPLREECEHFLHCVRTRDRPLTDGQSGLNVLRVLERSQDSLHLGGAPRELVV